MATTQTPHRTSLQVLRDKATRLRIDSVLSTTEAGSGHPTSCASAADIVSVLFYSVMRFDPMDPHRPGCDVFVLSKGHAAPLLYAAWAEAGAFPPQELLRLRRIDSDLEGHPTPRLPFVDVATGSLGQGICAAAGMAWEMKNLRHSPGRVYVLLGDGESAEGSVWEAAQWAAFNRLDNLCATIDINRLGQSQPTMLGYDLTTYRSRWEAFGWQVIPVDGHNVEALLEAYDRAAETTGRPTVILARTIKGKDLGFSIENADGWHGKPLPREMAEKVVAHLKDELSEADPQWQPELPPAVSGADVTAPSKFPETRSPYEPGSKESTRKGFGAGLAALASADPRIVALDGDVENSTYTEEFQKVAPNRFLECYIAEQNMAGVAMGLAARGRVPFASTFACFLTRAYDFIRMAAISQLNIKFAGTHAGVSIGEDGPSQMGLEDLAMMCAEPNFTVLYPADATAAWRATALVAEHKGPCYLRLGRPASPVLYGPEEKFAIGQCKVLRQSGQDRALIVAAGITVSEALSACDKLRDEGIQVRVIDLFSVQPIDQRELAASAHAAGNTVITVEDHYEHGGIGDAVFSALSGEGVRGRKLAVREIPHSGKAQELMEKFGIDAEHIVAAVKACLA